MEESAAIARVRVIAMLSTYSDLEEEGSSYDLESEVERADQTSRRQSHQPVRFSTLTSAREVGQPIRQGAVFYQIRNDLICQLIVTLQEHGRRVKLKFRAALTAESLQMFYQLWGS